MQDYKVSTMVSNYLSKELSMSEEQKGIISYSIETLLLVIIGFILVLTVGWLIGVPKATFFALISGDFLRKFSGGAHFSSPFPCLTTSAVIYPLISWIGIQAMYLWIDNPIYNIVLFVISIICIFIVWSYSPVDSIAKPIVSVGFRRKLRCLSVIVVISLSMIALYFNNDYIGVSIIAGLTIQSVTLLPVFNKKNNNKKEVAKNE